MRSRSILRVLAALAAFTLLVAACGSDDDSASSTAADSDSGTDDSADEGGDGAADGGGDAVEDDDGGEEADADVVDPSGSGDFCGLYVQNQDLLTGLDFSDPAKVQEWISTSTGLLDQAIVVAPSEIAGDLQIIRADFDTVAEVLADNDYDIFAAAETMDTMDTAEADAAGDRLDAYVESACGVDPDAAVDDLVEDNLDSMLENEAFLGMIVEGMTEGGELTEEQATCFLQNVDSDLLTGFAGDGGAEALSDPAVLQDLLGVFETCGIPLG